MMKKHEDRVPEEEPGFKAPIVVLGSKDDQAEARIEQRQEVSHQIRVLHANFNLGPPPDTVHMTLVELQTTRSQIMMRVQSMAASDAAFKMLQVTSLVTEQGLFKFGHIDVRGVAKDMMEPTVKGEVHEILSQMIAMGDLSLSALKPEVRLALLLSGLYATRYQMNQGRDQSNESDEEK